MGKGKKTCFLVTPIGELGSPVRKRVDQWKELIYKPVFEQEYKVVRADEIADPGRITEQILDHLINDDLVVIDYTGLNSNVMYEAAIRHIARKPFIQIHPASISLPFDIKDLRSLSYDIEDLDYPKKLRKNLRRSLESIEKKGYKTPTILQKEFDFDAMEKDPKEFISILKNAFGNEKYQEVPPRGRVVRMNDRMRTFSYDSIMYGQRVRCPNCGTLSEDTIGTFATSAISIDPKIYKCESCGTEFQP